MIDKLIIILFTFTFLVIIYFTTCYKKDNHYVATTTDISITEKSNKKVDQQPGFFIHPTEFQYNLLDYGPQCYGTNYNLPDSLYTRTDNRHSYFERLNFDHYIERIKEVDDLIYNENRNSIRDF